MKTTLKKKRADILEKAFKNYKFQDPDCKNKRPATGWMVIGHPGFTVAIETAGLPTANYWSGSNPTPSTQAPKEIVEFCYKHLSTEQI